MTRFAPQTRLIPPSQRAAHTGPALGTSPVHLRLLPQAYRRQARVAA